MKKQSLIISIIVVIISIFVSCSVNNDSEDVLTTAVADSIGTTHYYEPVTDEKGNVSTTKENQGIFAEIETNSDGKAVTKKNGTYVTNEHTTVLPIDSVTDDSSTTNPSTEKSSTNTTKHDALADNTVDFEHAEEINPTASTTTEKPTTTTTQNKTQPATDKDGWVTKWY